MNFRLDQEVINAIKTNGYLLKYLSYDRKKDELNKIFINTNARTGIKLLQYLNVAKYLELNKLDPSNLQLQALHQQLLNNKSLREKYKNNLKTIDSILSLTKLPLIEIGFNCNLSLNIFIIKCNLFNVFLYES